MEITSVIFVTTMIIGYFYFEIIDIYVMHLIHRKQAKIDKIAIAITCSLYR